MPTNGWGWRRKALLHSEGNLEFLWKSTSLVMLVLLAGGISVIIAFSQARELMQAVVYFGLYAFLTLSIGIVTLSLLWIARRRLEAWRPMSIAVLASGFAVTLSAGVAMASDALWTGWSATTDTDSGFLLLRSLAISTAICTTSIIAINNHLIARQAAARTKQAELDALRARVNPHFLFNTLNTATALLHERPGQAENVLLDLSDLFRAALSGDETASLERELQLTRRYLEIESLRLGDRLQVEWRLPERLPSLQLPTLALQSLVENAIRHGVEPATQPARLMISLGDDAGMTTLRVENPLPPRAEATTPRAGHRVGLAASRARIEAMTAGEGSLWTGVEGGQFVAEIRLPAGLPAASFRDETQPTTS